MFYFKANFLFPLTPSSTVIIHSEAQSSSLLAIDSGEKPPKITLCMAPILAQACIA